MSPATCIIPSDPIDVATWREDEEFARYPEGARAKTACFAPESLQLDFIMPGRRYLFKRSRQAYPEQFWAEIVAYCIGGLLGVEVPPAFPANNSVKGHCAALIEWFYVDGAALYVPGGSFMQKMIPGFDRERGTQHNFDSIRVLFRSFHQTNMMSEDWPDAWVSMLLFDALCGNTDRHQDNWGIVIDVEKRQPLARLSPAFDNGTSLGHELSEAHHGRWTHADVVRYVLRGCHHMKWQLNDTKRLGHIEGVRKLADLLPEKAATMHGLLTTFDTGILRQNLEKLAALPLLVRLSTWRAALICELVETRRQLLIEALQ